MSRRLVFWTDGWRYRWMVLAVGSGPTDRTILAKGVLDKRKVRHSPIADGILLAVKAEDHAIMGNCATVARYAGPGQPHRRLWLRDTGWVQR